jgi:methionyl-tRNA formyltransferase
VAPARTLFFGSGAFAVPVLEALLSIPTVDLVAVVTTPDRPAGRDRQVTATPVARRAADLGLPILRPASLRAPEAEAAISRSRPNLAVLADYGRIVPPAILGLPDAGFLNLHPSLLPRHRGATPIAATILAGDAEAGVTLFRMDAGLDTGPIVAQVAVPVLDDDTEDSLSERIKEAERRQLVHYVGRLVREGWTISGRKVTVP